jgi:hypothetical protein
MRKQAMTEAQKEAMNKSPERKLWSPTKVPGKKLWSSTNPQPANVDEPQYASLNAKRTANTENMKQSYGLNSENTGKTIQEDKPKKDPKVPQPMQSQQTGDKKASTASKKVSASNDQPNTAEREQMLTQKPEVEIQDQQEDETPRPAIRPRFGSLTLAESSDFGRWRATNLTYPKSEV